MVVFMDLVSGYLVVEEVADNRTYETWYTLVNARLEALGVRVLYLVSDRAKALVKLAETGLDCLSIPDLFHLIHDLVKSYSLAIGRRLQQARRDLDHAQEHLRKPRHDLHYIPVHFSRPYPVRTNSNSTNCCVETDLCPCRRRV